jgi:hypothetical protein
MPEAQFLQLKAYLLSIRPADKATRSLCRYCVDLPKFECGIGVLNFAPLPQMVIEAQEHFLEPHKESTSL